MIRIKFEQKNKLKECLKKYHPKLIFFAETHGFLDDSRYQKIILLNYEPDVFLYEMLEDKDLSSKKEIKDFLKHTSDEKFSLISTYGELKKTIQLSEELSIPIKGIDLKNMGRKNTDFMKIINPTKKEMKFEMKLLKKRELHQMKKIKESLRKYKRVFVTLGAYHLRADSPLKKISKDVLIVYPVADDEIIFSPEGNENKKYSFIITDGFYDGKEI